MNKSTLIYSALLIMVWLNILSCDQNRSKKNDVEFDKLEVNEKVFLLPVNDTTLPFSQVEIELTYPKKFNNKEDLARLQQIFNGTFFNDQSYDSLSPQEALKKYLESYTIEYRELSNQYYQDKANLKSSEMPSWYWYYLHKSNEILFEDKSILSYSVEHSDYTGGAHGSLNVMYYIIDLENLTTVTQEDIFKPNYHNFLTSKIIEKLMEKYEVNEADQLINEGFFDINEIEPNNNFWMNNEGIHYVYNQYEIAPYSMGPIEVTIPFEDITSIIIPESIAGNYIK